ncbi:CheR family methyltransferase [Aeoliella mucimassa]|uniref:protein-glutamate O-methyltransferase n=1 Tax=Aeoliella mucimassa TaxID=2527972 RepID=A0A518ATG2_9BACT|nr:protein-glutamate O-methyltransferase CheR [Aeoliella mucimassa]QDU58011.1 Chemotaxis protein methyltransferase Cher2 [Aeoliella mucimassa]
MSLAAQVQATLNTKAAAPGADGGVTALIDFIDELCGVYLDDSKGYLIESRIAPIVRRLECRDYADLVNRAKAFSGQEIRSDIIDAITTHETLFFRDESPFKALRFKVIPDLIQHIESTGRQRRVRIWSAACSTGQEVYSIAMVLHDIAQDLPGWDLQILGTDVSPASVATAQRGWYSNLEVGRGLDAMSKSNYFSHEAEGWQVAPQLQRFTKFEVRNLLKPYPERGLFDIVFCRNVAIYFKPDQRASVFNRMVETITPGGWLFVGSAERLSDLGPQFTPQTHCNCTCYRPKPI